MPDDDWMLAQGTVEFRQAERDHANGRDRSPSRRRVVYLAGPISLGGTCDDATIAAFTEVFTRSARRLRTAGYEVLNPCECPPQDSWEGYMRHGITSVCRADLIAVLPRWMESRGAMLEAFVARQLGIPVVPVELCGDKGFDAAAGVSPETEPAAAKEAR